MNKKVRAVCLACDMPTGPPLPSLPNIIKLSQTVWELWPAQDFGFRGDNYISKTVRVVSLARDTPTKYYQNIYKGIEINGAHKDASTDGRTDAMQIAISPEPISRG